MGLYEEETRYTYREMISILFFSCGYEELPDTKKYWDIVFEYFTCI